jgi:hypothetical protein
MDGLRFTYDRYRDLLEGLLNDGYSFRCFSDGLGEGDVLLRHDVDYSPRKAKEIAEIESDMGVSSTFFFLVSTPLYNILAKQAREYIAAIDELGHNIQLHFSTHAYWDDRPAEKELMARIDAEWKVLASVVDIDQSVVAFHNPPGWVIGRKIPEYTNTYKPQFFRDLQYVADSNQRWRDEQTVLEGFESTFQLLVHPILWGEFDASTVERISTEREHIFEMIERHMRSENELYRAHRNQQ